MSQIPQNPVMLLSFINTRLRDRYHSLQECCDDLQLQQQKLEDDMKQIGYFYNDLQNQFI